MAGRDIRRVWSGLTLALQFAVAGGVVILAAALAVGSVVANRIEEAVVRNTANATALYMESFVAPITQDLTQQETLSTRSQKDMAQLLAQTELGRRVVSFKVWRKGGFVLDASNRALIGQSFAVSDNLRAAWGGQVTGEFEDTRDAEDAAEDAMGLPLLEIYAPVRHRTTGEVIAVVEFYEIAETLKDDIQRARALTWLWVVGILGVIGAALFLVVLRGSRTIDAQILALKDMSLRNLALRVQIQHASARSATLGERALRQIGADLHDGPAQLMAFAALRLDALKSQSADDRQRADLAEVAAAVSEAITEIRTLSRGLSVPDLDRRDMGEVLEGLADGHAARTGTAVRMTGGTGDLPDLPPALRLCIYRFVQEGLTNAWRHAGGRGQELRIGIQGGKLQLSVLDEGPGFAPHGPAEGTVAEAESVSTEGPRLGLAGLKDRVEALGGRLDLLARTGPDGLPAKGAELRMTIEISGP